MMLSFNFKVICVRDVSQGIKYKKLLRFENRDLEW